MRRFRQLAVVIVVVFLIALLLPTSVVNAQVVTFPDPNLEAAIREAIAKPTGDIYQSDLNGLTTLSAHSRVITNLSGLEHCTSLTSLDLYDNQISNLSPLAGLTNLTQLWLHSNQISNISPLAGLTNLTMLELKYNQISNLSPLAGLTNLTMLDLMGNQISNLSPLSGLTSLWYVQLSSNQISDISPLTGLTNLTQLVLSYNQISNLSPLSGLTSLWYLQLSSNQISDVSPLVANAGLSAGDTVSLLQNPLSPDSLNTYIPQLEARLVNVLYDDTPTPTSTPSSGEHKGCFIATAAYGTPMAEEIEVLREFRDQYMLTNPVGSALVSAYYKLSPPVAQFIDDHPTLKPIVRAGLLPAVALSTLAVNTTLAEKIAMVSGLSLVSLALGIWLTRRALPQ
ncbi:MAG TPA: leucine-rich repeat domain-containing protein [Dehalococcoidia bacterium]|nr:leucine-rich repeat domain-containing protein [Dehalococcoidia bacterium]